MTIEQTILNEIKELNNKLEDIRTQFIFPKTDVVTNEEYCRIRTKMGMPLTGRGLREWFKKNAHVKPCPRVDSRRVSVSAVNKWAEEYFTNKNQ